MKNFMVNKTKGNPLLRENCTSTADFKNKNKEYPPTTPQKTQTYLLITSGFGRLENVTNIGNNPI